MEDRICPYNSVREMQHFASSLAMSRVSPPAITWSHDYSSVSFRGTSIKIDDMRQGLITMEQKIKDIFDDVSMHHVIPYQIPPNLIDDMTNSTAGYSWLDNGHFTNGNNALLKVLLDEPKCRLGCINSAGEFQWNMVAAHTIMTKLRDANAYLSVLLHIIPSQPSRAPEHVDNKIRNSWRLRNLFMRDGEMWMITQYTKTSNITGHDSFLPMLIPTRLAQLLQKYLLIFRPLELVLANSIWGEAAMQVYHDYLYVDMGKKVNPEDFSQTLGLTI